MAAEAGHAAAQENLAGLYYQGQGVAQDRAAALKWFLLAAQAGEAPAQRMVGVFYQNGYGVPQDYAETAKWFRRAAEQGDAPSQSGLAVLYLNGMGVPKDFVEGYRWASLAAGQGDEASRKNCDAASRLMTPDQVKEAQRLASGFVARKDNGMPQQSGALPDSPIAKYGGTGFFITDDGYVLTSAHVVENAVRIEIFAAGKALAAKLVKADVANDIALLKVDTSCKALALSASRGVNLGDLVFTIGFPGTVLQGTAPKLTQGEVTSLAGILDDPRHFQTSLAVQPGNSGGPLLDRCGNVIGIIAARLGDIAAFKTADVLPQNVSYAVKMSLVLPTLESVPGMAAKLKTPHPAQARPFEDTVQEARNAAVLVLVY
jgi:S1-C subfamily serine protease